MFSVTVEGHRLDRLRTRSGQFFIWRFRDGPGWSRGNPYTISAAPTADRLRVTIQAVGEGSARVERLQPGTKVAIEGPYGTMTAERRRHPRMLVMAAGVGITPMRALIEDTPFAPGDATLIYRYRRDPIFRDELEEIAERRGVELHLLPGSRARGRTRGSHTATTSRSCCGSSPTSPTATSTSAARWRGSPPSAAR